MRNARGRAGAIIRTIWRSGLILVAAMLIAAATGAVEGRPTPARARLERDAPYGPTWPFGLVQLFGQSAIFGAGVVVARRYLRVRL